MLKMKIKTIDILNKIANNEEVPEKIMFDEWLYIYNEREKTYYDEEDRTLWQSYNFKILTDEVAIIEEPKKIEKLDVALLGQCDNWLRCPTNKVTKQDVELNPYIIDNIRENTLYFQRKINELIDEINNLKEK